MEYFFVWNIQTIKLAYTCIQSKYQYIILSELLQNICKCSSVTPLAYDNLKNAFLTQQIYIWFLYVSCLNVIILHNIQEIPHVHVCQSLQIFNAMLKIIEHKNMNY